MQTIITNTHVTTIPRPQVDIALMQSMQRKAQLAGDELQRMESEGGIALDCDQSAKADAYLVTSWRLKKALRDTQKVPTQTYTTPPIITIGDWGWGAIDCTPARISARPLLWPQSLVAWAYRFFTPRSISSYRK